MEILSIDDSIFSHLHIPDAHSHKGQNGRLLVIAGSEKFHGALLLAVETASRVVDMVYVYTTPHHRHLIEALKPEVATCIPVLEEEVEDTVALVDVILMGPGLDESEETIAFIHQLIKNHPEKKMVIDATALWHVQPQMLHANTVVTPHSREFTHVFGRSPTPEQVLAAARETGACIVLTGKEDYMSDGISLWRNNAGNVGLTKGGTGDVLASMIASFAATNPLVLSAQAGTRLTSLAGDVLHADVGTFYNASDVIKALGALWKTIIQKHYVSPPSKNNWTGV